MDNKKLHIFTDSERGHRPRIDKNHKTKMYGICLPEPLFVYAKKIGPVAIRSMIENDMESTSQKSDR